jgi:4,5-dihydroxyphthalate decarboxylase
MGPTVVDILKEISRMTRPSLTTVTRPQGNNRALIAGDVTLPDFDLAFQDMPVLVKGFRRMVRDLEFDICEMALTTYLTARAHGVKFTALPVFLVRDFHHGNMVWNTGLGMARPKDLEGRRVGVNRGYTVTTGVWARSILQDEHDVDLSRVKWAPSGDEHVASFVNPSNVVNLAADEVMEDAVQSGALAGVVGTRIDRPGVAPIVDDGFAAGVAALKGRGLYPINHLVVVRDTTLAAYPGLAGQLFDAFSESKRGYVAELKAGRISDLTASDRVHLAALDVMDDPLPYGIAPNEKVLSMLMNHAVTQGIIPERPPLESLFAADVLGRVG